MVLTNDGFIAEPGMRGFMMAGGILKGANFEAIMNRVKSQS